MVKVIGITFVPVVNSQPLKSLSSNIKLYSCGTVLYVVSFVISPKLVTPLFIGWIADTPGLSAFMALRVSTNTDGELTVTIIL